MEKKVGKVGYEFHPVDVVSAVECGSIDVGVDFSGAACGQPRPAAVGDRFERGHGDDDDEPRDETGGESGVGENRGRVGEIEY